jgi:DGQHR domain-containing protein
MSEPIRLACLEGQSADRMVLLGFASASLLCRLSFPDVLDEATGEGYQRPFNERHSLDFRKYIQSANSATIPLTLNLRPDHADAWSLSRASDGRIDLVIDRDAVNIMAQVDCQHRLGHLDDLATPLPFMCFIGLSRQEEMEIFSVINGKAKGLSASLLDFHAAQLAEDLAGERPELFVALHLNNDPDSPWHRLLNIGGKPTLGLKRVASLRLMQQAVAEFLKASGALNRLGPAGAAALVCDFWKAVATVLPGAWKDSRKHLLTKGVGVYALMTIAADIVRESEASGRTCDKRAFAAALQDFATDLDWSTTGPLKGFGGQAGVKAAVEFIREARSRSRLKVVNG